MRAKSIMLVYICCMIELVHWNGICVENNADRDAFCAPYTIHRYVATIKPCMSEARKLNSEIVSHGTRGQVCNLKLNHMYVFELNGVK